MNENGKIKKLIVAILATARLKCFRCAIPDATPFYMNALMKQDFTEIIGVVSACKSSPNFLSMA